MNIKVGEMFVPENKHIIVTTNSFVCTDGRLVMGRGAALMAKQKFPGIDKLAGDYILSTCGHCGTYGYIVLAFCDLFQVKRHFKDNAEPSIIAKSATYLANQLKEFPDTEYHMNFPGIGYGFISAKQVFDSIFVLKQFNNLTLWLHKENSEIEEWNKHRGV